MTRRSFLDKSGKTTLAALAASQMIAPAIVKAAGQNPDKIRLGLVGCGNRGTGAVMDAIRSTPNVELVAMADLFPDKIEKSLSKLRRSQKGKTREAGAMYGSLQTDWDRMDAIKITPETCFTGFDSCDQLLKTDVDIVILAEPPAFRPRDIRKVLNAGKHVFAEKPVSVDPVGTRIAFDAVELAKSKNLGFMGGTQLRYNPAYVENMRRVHDGQIGEIISLEGYWWDQYYVKAKAFDREPEWSDMEYQIRCWNQFVWLSGDHIVENLVHNIDILNWAMGSVPKSATAQGGHINWEDWKVKGNVYDHFYVEYTYPNGVVGHASSRQNLNCSHRIGERIRGSKGICNPYAGIEGDNPYEFPGPFDNPRLHQWKAFIESIRDGNPLNKGKQVTEASMTAILGRMSAYTGRSMNYDWALQRSQLDTFPKNLEFGPLPVDPLAIPGKTKPV